MLQNIHLHGAISDKMGNPFNLILAQNMDEYQLTCTNMVRVETAKKITNALEHIKRMNEKELKNHYMEVLSNEQYSVQGGAGLGLITIALKCHNHFTFDNIPINEQITLFSITAIITDK